MSLAALGCNPEHSGHSLADIGGAALGQLGFSAAGEMYVAIRAGAAISKYEACFIGAGMDAIPNAQLTSRRGVPVCVPQVALANNEYGWGLVYGIGRVRTDGGVAAASGFGLSGTNEELDSASAGAETIAGMVALKADDANDGEVFLQFPAVSTDTS